MDHKRSEVIINTARLLGYHVKTAKRVNGVLLWSRIFGPDGEPIGDERDGTFILFPSSPLTLYHPRVVGDMKERFGIDL